MGTAVGGLACDCGRQRNARRRRSGWEVATRWAAHGPFGASQTKRTRRTLPTSYVSFLTLSSFIGIFPSFHLFISSVVLSDQQQIPPPVMHNMTSIRRQALLNNNFPVANPSICPHNKALATSWVEDSPQAPSACLVWLERCQTISLRHLRRCRIMINNDL